MIINAYKTELMKNLKVTIRDCCITISKNLGIGQRTVSNVISEYNTKGTVTSPCKTREKKSYKDLYDDLQLNTNCLTFVLLNLNTKKVWLASKFKI